MPPTRPLALVPLCTSAVSRPSRPAPSATRCTDGLRPPTVLHHLNQLRMAGMVQILLSEEGERQFSPRYDGFENTIDLLKQFVQGE